MGKIPVILDCDNTMGVPGCDVDDGMALLYLLGCPEVRLLGVTCAYGNSTQETVYQNTVRLLKAWGREDIPVLRGAESGHGADLSASMASAFLREHAQRRSGELVVIATGSMTNLLGAERRKPGFFRDVRMFSLMGGLTEPLLVGGQPMSELNLSCDPEASVSVCRLGGDVRIATAQNSLRSMINEEVFVQEMGDHPGELAEFLRRELAYWFRYYRENYRLGGFVCWDVMAAVQAIHPEMLNMKKCWISPTPESLSTGMLISEGTDEADGTAATTGTDGTSVPEVEVYLPEIEDLEAYTRHVYGTIFSAAVDIR